ncbi:hypothetical protein V866_007521 [Kwoniella sp. B9012]|uniref:F-box domain-containing protein n=1 Tax=Kwoniella europaea PYCC6329 TaxID=1423913 RepID=A0AAX4KPC2_9TREE
MAPSKKKGTLPNPSPTRRSPRTHKSVTDPLVSDSPQPQLMSGRPTTSNHSSILHLPNEVLDQIFSYVSNDTDNTEDLLSCCLVSKDFCQLSSALLWDHLVLSPRSKDHNDEEVETRIPIFRRTLDQLCSGKSIAFEHLLSKVRYLTLDCHLERWCRPTKGLLRLTNLQVLRINFYSGYWVHRRSISQRCKGERCKLISDIQPSTIIIRGWMVSRNPLYNLSAWPSSLWINVHDLFLVPSDYSSFPGETLDLGLPADLVNKVKSITWIFEPIDRTSSPAITARYYNTCSLVRFVFTSKQIGNVAFTIVNPAHLGSSSTTIKGDVDRLKNAFLNSAIELGIGKEDLDRRLEHTKFLSMDQWIEMRDEWKGKFTERELMGWKEAFDRR